MQSKSSWKPAIGAVLLCSLVWFSIAAWQSDYAIEAHLARQSHSSGIVQPQPETAKRTQTPSEPFQIAANRTADLNSISANDLQTVRAVASPTQEEIESVFGPPGNSAEHPGMFSRVSTPVATSAQVQHQRPTMIEHQSHWLESFDIGELTPKQSELTSIEVTHESNDYDTSGAEKIEQFVSHQESVAKPEAPQADDWGTAASNEFSGQEDASRSPSTTAEQTLETDQASVLSPSQPEPTTPEPPSIVENSTTLDLVEIAEMKLSDESLESESVEDELPSQNISTRLTDQIDETETEEKEVKPSPKWVAVPAINSQLENLAGIELTRNWAEQNMTILSELEAIAIADPLSAGLLKQIGIQLNDLNNLIVRSSIYPASHPDDAQGPLAIELRRLQYRMERRMGIWTLAHQLAAQELHTLADLEDYSGTAFRQASNVRLNFDSLPPQWYEYLRLDEVEKAFNSVGSTDLKKKVAAKKALARIYSPVHTSDQDALIKQLLDPQLVGYLRDAASESFDFRALLEMIERHEYEESGYTSYRLNEMYQSLIWSRDEASQALAGQLESHYRNANSRIAVSERLMNRLVPQMPSTNEPFNDNVMGAQVRGQNYIQNRIQIKLIPDPERVHLNVVSLGEVYSQTQANRSGFTIQNEGASRFQVFKRLSIGRTGVSTSYPVAYAQSNQRVVGLRSNLDPIPIVGWAARRLASQKIQQQKPATQQYTKRQIEQKASQRVQEEVESKLNRVRHYMYTNLLQPLVAMDLEPEAVEMQTTSDRILTRYRLAGRDQMAANTARPRALAGSLLSLQFHDSMINNLLTRVDLNGRKFTAEELMEHLRKVLGSKQLGVNAQQLEHKVEFEFAHLDPIRVDFEEGKIRIKMNLQSLQINDGKRWKKLSIDSLYIPYIQGMKLVLVKDEESGIGLTGRRLRVSDKVIVRKVFTSVFKEQFNLNALPRQMATLLSREELQIAQFVVTNGWIGISINEIGLPAGMVPGPNQQHSSQDTAPISRSAQRRIRAFNFGDRR